jgi:uncharacterized protein (TIGR03083 family)
VALTTAVISTAHLFGELDAALVSLLKSLDRVEWSLPTIVPRWNVQQVAAHLLDTALRRLALCRDGWVTPGPPITSERDLVQLIDRLNAQGVETLGRCSPELIVTLTESIAPQLASYLKSLDPMAPAAFSVSWAGERESLNWFDVAREFTERWHHQQQIRLATNREGIMTPKLYQPVLETFMRALPHTYRTVDAAVGTTCDVVVPGDCGGRWRLRRQPDGWALVAPTADEARATCVLPPEIAWRVFTRGISPSDAEARADIRGDKALGRVVLSALAIVAEVPR